MFQIVSIQTGSYRYFAIVDSETGLQVPQYREGETFPLFAASYNVTKGSGYGIYDGPMWDGPPDLKIDETLSKFAFYGLAKDAVRNNVPIATAVAKANKLYAEKLAAAAAKKAKSAPAPAPAPAKGDDVDVAELFAAVVVASIAAVKDNRKGPTPSADAIRNMLLSGRQQRLFTPAENNALFKAWPTFNAEAALTKWIELGKPLTREETLSAWNKVESEVEEEEDFFGSF